MTTLRQLLSREPVRLYVYGLALALVAAAVARGVVDDDLADVLALLLPALLAVPAAEGARSRVTPTARREPAEVERLHDPAADPARAADRAALEQQLDRDQ